MRFCLAILAAASLPAVAAPAPASGPEDAFVRVSARDKRYFELTGGAAYIPIGLNMIGPPGANRSEEEALRGMEVWLASLSANGGNYIRVWLSNPFWDVEHEKSGVYDEERARRIDRLLELCRKYGIRVKMTLEHFRSIGGGYGWELWNEINAVRGGDFMAWTQAMLPELHKTFPKNMAMQSLGSFDTERVRDLYRRHSTLEGNDVAQVHRYLDLGASLEVCKGPVDVMAADAVRELRSYEPGKPIILAESGAVEPRHTGPFKLYRADREGTLLHDILFAPFFAGAAGPGQIWHWDAYVAANDLWRHFGRFAEVVRGLDPPAEGFEPLMLEHDRLRVYVLRGRRTVLAWCRDKKNNWETELKNGEKPEALHGLEIDLRSVLAGNSPREMRVYDPWPGKWSQVKPRKGTVALPAFSRSIVLRITR